MCLFLFTICFGLIVGLSVGLLAFPVGLVIKKFRGHIPKLVQLCIMLFAGLVVMHSLIYWSFMSFESNYDGFVLDTHPFPDMVMFTLNWQIPCMIVVIIGMLISKRKMKMGLLLWVYLAVAAVSISGFLILAYYFCPYCMDVDLRAAAWWL